MRSLKPVVSFEQLSFKPRSPGGGFEWLDILLGDLRVKAWDWGGGGGGGGRAGPGSPEARLGKPVLNGQ